MKAWKKLIFIFIAYSLTLMHTVVPHQHESVASGKGITQVQAAGCSSLVGFLQVLFSADLGSNHLEKFKNSSAADLDLSFSAILLYLTVTALTVLSCSLYVRRPLCRYIEKLCQRLLLFTSKPLRAPPSFA